MKIIQEHSYSSVYMVPQKCIVKSRTECDISVMLGEFSFKNPIIPADMPSVVNFETCEAFAKLGMFYVMHRFGISNKEFEKLNALLLETHKLINLGPIISEEVKELLIKYFDIEDDYADDPSNVDFDELYIYLENDHKRLSAMTTFLILTP